MCLVAFWEHLYFSENGWASENAASPILFFPQDKHTVAYTDKYITNIHKYPFLDRQLTLCSWLAICTCKFQFYAWKEFIHGHKHSPCKLVRAATHTHMFYRGKLKIFFRCWLRTTAFLPPGKTTALNPPRIHHLNFRSHLLANFGVRPCT